MEAEAHHHIEPNDSFGKMIGVQTAILAVLLSIFTICAHREHTDTIIFGNEATDTWSHYQAKRIRAYQLEMNTGLIKLLAPNSAETANTLEEYAQQTQKYTKDLEEIKKQAEVKVETGELAHHKSGFFDLAEGLVEIGVILSSLYFISRRKLFPMMGLLLGLCGTVVGVLGFLLH